MADDNKLTGLSLTSGGIPYPVAQPMQMGNPLAQIQQLQGLDLQNQQLQQGQASLGENRINAVKNMLGTLVTKQDLSIDDVNSRLDDLGRNRVLPPQEVASIKGMWSQFANNPAALQAKVKQVYLETLAHDSRMGMGFGTTVPVSSPAGTNFFSANPMQPGVLRNPAAGNAPTTFVPAGTSPGERTAPHQAIAPGGGVINTTVGQNAAAAGMNPVTGAPLAGTFGQPGGSPQGYAGPNPQQLGSNIKAYTDDMLAAQPMAQTIRDSSIALQLADKLGTTGTGPGTGVINDVRASMESLGITAPNDIVSMRNELDKYLAKNITGSPMAQRSDMGTLAQKLAEPNTATQTNKATRDLLKSKIAQFSMDIATPYAHDIQSDPYGYLGHKGKFTQSQDQGAYAIAQGLVAPQEAAKKINEMRNLPADNAQRKKFFDSLTNAKKAGLWNLPGATSAPGQ
jgi:hypothetical protein